METQRFFEPRQASPFTPTRTGTRPTSAAVLYHQSTAANRQAASTALVARHNAAVHADAAMELERYRKHQLQQQREQQVDVERETLQQQQQQQQQMQQQREQEHAQQRQREVDLSEKWGSLQQFDWKVEQEALPAWQRRVERQFRHLDTNDSGFLAGDDLWALAEWLWSDNNPTQPAPTEDEIRTTAAQLLRQSDSDALTLEQVVIYHTTAAGPRQRPSSRGGLRADDVANGVSDDMAEPYRSIQRAETEEEDPEPPPLGGLLDPPETALSANRGGLHFRLEQLFRDCDTEDTGMAPRSDLCKAIQAMQQEAETPLEVREYASLDGLLEEDGNSIMEVDDWLIAVEKWMEMGDPRDREGLVVAECSAPSPATSPTTSLATSSATPSAVVVACYKPHADTFSQLHAAFRPEKVELRLEWPSSLINSTRVHIDLW